MQSLGFTDYHFANATGTYKGKVRDVYFFGPRLAVVTTDRISAFDHILPEAIPYKGQVLNQVAVHFLQATEDIVPNWLLNSPHPNVSIGLYCEPYKVEMVVRGYLAGHAWREYSLGNRLLCGVALPDGLKEGDKLPSPIITPSTKASSGHDEDISREEIIRRALVPEAEYVLLEKYALDLFKRGTEMAAKQHLILVDTKYEFGNHNGEVYLIDEVHTPDSSRYYYADGYADRQVCGIPQQQLSKEFVREWLMAQGFQGKDGQVMPDMPPAFIAEVSDRYKALYEQITGLSFDSSQPADADTIQRVIIETV